ncbi:glutaredoxin family protein [Geminocystis sp. NIES-3709]|uniref:glutaredoxin family protein n=1 Tax=Geminocystis sp. NIES-3709 TaxID=1617448 RepID=UPI0005FCC65B|nr:glutaredoxin family protein [Geminocystis sp. NIES-3709]BAQ66037.1 glutaredoxin 2 [Geminocystis sp. NIES-3709]
MKLILYSKPGCHLCEGLEEKLNSVTDISLDIEIRDISTNNQWWELYQYEIPVLFIVKENQKFLIPRVSPRISVGQLTKILQKYLL